MKAITCRDGACLEIGSPMLSASVYAARVETRFTTGTEAEADDENGAAWAAAWSVTAKGSRSEQCIM